MRPNGAYCAQVWNGQECLTDIKGLSYDAAREVASSALLTGHTGRAMAEDGDYCEVWDPKRGFRSGTFGETVIVTRSV